MTSRYWLLLGHNNCGDEMTLFEYRTVIVSIGYFMYDFWCMVWFGIADFDMSLHHICAVFMPGYMLWTGNSTVFYMGVLAVGEWSNPFMHSRFLLRNAGLRYTHAYNFCEDMYFRLFFVGRMGFGHWMTYHLFICEDIHLSLIHI